MSDATADGPVASEPADSKEQSQRLALLWATIAPSQAPGHSGYVAGIRTMREARSLVLETVGERLGRLVRDSESVVVASLPDATEALKAAISIQRIAAEKKDRMARLNIRIFVHFGGGAISEEELQRDLATAVAKMSDVARAGHIYASMAAYHNTEGLNAVEFRPVGPSENAQIGRPSYYDVVWRPETDCSQGTVAPGARREDVGQFIHGAALVAGAHAPCFYCGSRKHRTTNCPSKHLPYATDGLVKLGDLSINEINRLFSQYLNLTGEDLSVLPEPSSKDDESLAFLAPWSFYELKRVFQLRFLDVVWNAPAKAEWHKARQRRTEGSPEGGMLWLARDCIRTSRLEEAENLLRRYGRRNSYDYRAPCGLAFVKIEKENYITAADFLTDALGMRVGNMQRAYLLILLSRVSEFITSSSGEEKLREALAIESFCPEAMFELIIRYFKGRREADAANRLVRLIRTYKEYYPAALISPDLARFHETISAELEKVLVETRGEADKAVEEADKGLAVLKGFLGEDDPEIAAVISSHRQLYELLEKPGTLVNCYETIGRAERIIASCKSLDRERSAYAAAVIQKIEARAGQAIKRSSQPRKALALSQPVLALLVRLRESLRARAPLAPCLAQCAEAERVAGITEAAIKKMDACHALLKLATQLLRDIVLTSCITAVVGLLLFPGALALLRVFHAGSLPAGSSQILVGQKAILLTGGLFAVIFAALHALLTKRGRQRFNSPG